MNQESKGRKANASFLFTPTTAVTDIERSENT